MEKQLGSSDFGIEEKKYGEGFETKYVMGSSNAPANERTKLMEIELFISRKTHV